MKKIIVITLLTLISISMSSQKIIFIHHSTGGGVYNGGIGLSKWFQNYNTANSKSYQISEVSYPDSPYPWENYAYDYWNLWINKKCDNTKPGIYCLDKFTSAYDVIIFKHCYPGAGIVADQGTASVSSNVKSLQNYKLQYRALRELMDTYPNKKFIVWTLAPLHRNATNAESAARARQFVDWVKNDWLKEDNKTHANIFIFDFYGYAAESNQNPANGKVNCLKYEYEGDHNGSDSHPNATANTFIMPLFGQFIVDVLKSTTTGFKAMDQTKLKMYPNPANNYLKVEGASNLKSIEIIDVNGKLLLQVDQPKESVDVSTLQKGTYIIKLYSKSNIECQKLLIE